MKHSRLTHIGRRLDKIKDYIINKKIGDIFALRHIINIFENLIDSSVTQFEEDEIYKELYNITMTYISRQTQNDQEDLLKEIKENLKRIKEENA